MLVRESVNVPGKVLCITFGFNVCVLQSSNSLNIIIVSVHIFITKQKLFPYTENKNSVFTQIFPQNLSMVDI